MVLEPSVGTAVLDSSLPTAPALGLALSAIVCILPALFETLRYADCRLYPPCRTYGGSYSAEYFFSILEWGDYRGVRVCVSSVIVL